MTDLVDPNSIEEIVGTPRSPILHYGRIVGETFYIMHSGHCVEEHLDLRECVYSDSLDLLGIHEAMQDRFGGPTPLQLERGWIVPLDWCIRL